MEMSARSRYGVAAAAFTTAAISSKRTNDPAWLPASLAFAAIASAALAYVSHVRSDTGGRSNA
jgi:signal recognition particle GTPase